MAASSPEFCVWETTLACNLVCVHCGSAAGRSRRQELTTAEALNLIEQLAALGVRELTLSGGEFILRPDWKQLLAHARAAGLKNLIVSNGLAITAEIADEFARQGVGSVSLSVDGGEAVHNRLRPVNRECSSVTNSYRHLVNAVASLKAAGVTVAIITQVSKENLHELATIASFLDAHGIRLWQLQLTNPMGRLSRPGTGPRDPVGILDPGEVPLVHRFIRRIQNEGRIRCLASDNIGYFTPDEHLLRSHRQRGDSFWTGCSAGINVLGITSDGTVRGCLSMPPALNAGNVRTQSLREIWENDDSFAYNRRFRREDLTGPCRECEFGKLCRAGCHSFTQTALGTMTENRHCLRLVAESTSK